MLASRRAVAVLVLAIAFGVCGSLVYEVAVAGGFSGLAPAGASGPDKKRVARSDVQVTEPLPTKIAVELVAARRRLSQRNESGSSEQVATGSAAEERDGANDGLFRTPKTRPFALNHPDDHFLLEAYLSLSALKQYSNRYGPLPVSPLSVDVREFRVWRERQPPEAWPVEPYHAGYPRISAVNSSTPNPLAKREGSLQVLAYQKGGSLESIVGRQLGRDRTTAEGLVRLMVHRVYEEEVRVRELSTEVQQALYALAVKYLDRYEDARRDFYSVAKRVVDEKLSQGLSEREVVAFYVDIWRKAHILRTGDDAELDAILERFEAAEKETRRAVMEALTG
ncbi:MAG: hypothetical protein O7H41_20255 [Planctomycetota bacterium]|nr:hypothetical protein [Planctomycetota bacterium]